MRKSILLLVLPLLAVFYFTSCKKQVSSDHASNQEIVAKVNAWLDDNKSEKQPGHAANIEMLKSNLEFSQFRIEESSHNEKIIVIPINERLKTEKSIDPNAVPNLVLILDASRQIRKGNIVLYFPENKAVKRVPDNTFHAILNTAKPNANGIFRYLSVTGRTLHELEYKDGRLRSFRKIDNLSIGSPFHSTTNMCVDWYWVYTEYDVWGNIVDQWEQYTGTTCQSESCSDPYAAMVCPMDGGGGGGDSEEYEVETIRTGTLQWTLTELNAQVGSGTLRETSRVRGKFYLRNPQNDCLDHYYGGDVFLENNSFGMENVSFSNQARTGTILSCDAVRLSSSGRATFPTFPNDANVDYSRTSDFERGQFSWN
jgi:hypothetical protein